MQLLKDWKDWKEGKDWREWTGFVPTLVRETASLRGWALLKVPLIAWVRPWVTELTEERVVVKIPLTRRTRNHLRSMYFGVLAVGADCAGGLLAMHFIRTRGRKISLVFKDLKADFLKRPEGDVLFTCEDGRMILEKVDKAEATGERVSFPVTVVATCPSKLGSEPVARFVLTLSLKKLK